MHEGDRATATWTPQADSQSLECTVTGSNGDQWTNTSSGATITHETRPITSRTTYTLDCESVVTNEILAPQTEVVNLIPRFQEPQ